MASDRETVAFIAEVMEGAGDVSTRAMFGEYALYLDGKVIALIDEPPSELEGEVLDARPAAPPPVRR